MGTIGHLVLFTLLIMSIYSTGVMIDRWRLFRRAQTQSRRFAESTRDLLAEGRLDDVVAEARKYPRSHLARIYSAAIRDLPPDWELNGLDDRFENILRGAAERESVVITQELKRGLSSLASITSTAPFVGLFGTVIGIMNSFFGMAAAGSGGLGAVAGGIAEALVNTAAGILVALPAAWAFNHFLGRMDSVHSEMGNAKSELIDTLIKKSRSRSWKAEGTTGRMVTR